MKIFIDTNIFLDLILKRKNYKEALTIFSSIEKKRFKAVILDITILNIDYIASKQTKEIRSFLAIINQFFEIVGASNETISKALEIKNKDLEDNLQYISAKDSNCKLIISNDKKFYKGSLEVLKSEAFIDKYLQNPL
jgi:predicted nucleic acid-binding protein